MCSVKDKGLGTVPSCRGHRGGNKSIEKGKMVHGQNSVLQGYVGCFCPSRNVEMLAIVWPVSGDFCVPPVSYHEGKSIVSQKETGGWAVNVEEEAEHCLLHCPEPSPGEHSTMTMGP